MELKTSAIVDPESEKILAKEYWSKEGTQPLLYKNNFHYIRAFFDAFQRLSVSKILEFGCGSGRNLEFIKRNYNGGEVTLCGVDVNRSAVQYGKDVFGIDVRLGDETSLSGIKEDEFDFVFTVSVLDHLPEPSLAVREMARISSGVCLFIEPSAPENVTESLKVEQNFSQWQKQTSNDATPSTYVHNYSRIFEECGLRNLIEIPLPTHLNKLGPFYRAYLCTKKKSQEDEIYWNEIADGIMRSSQLSLLDNLYVSGKTNPKATEKLKELNAETRALRTELEAAKATLKKSEHEKQELRAKIDEFDVHMEAQRAHASAISKEAYQLGRDLKKSATWGAALERRIDELENSGSFRIGNALIRATRSPRALVRLPIDVWTIVRQKRRKEKALRRPNVSDGPENKIARIHREKGVEGIVEHVTALHPTDTTSRGKVLVAATKAIAEQGHPHDALALAKMAVAAEETEPAARSLYWAAQRVSDLQAGWEAIRVMERLQEARPTSRQRDFLQRMHAGAAYQISLLELIPTEPEHTITAIPDRICYLLHNSLPVSSGGYATRAHGLARGLTEAGFEVICLTRPGFPLDTNPNLPLGTVRLEETVEGIRYRRLMRPTRVGRPAVEYIPAAADAMTEALKELRPAYVIAASNHHTSLPALIAARRLGLPFFYEIRGFWEITRVSRDPGFVDMPEYKIQELLEAEVARHADHVFTLTGPMKEEMIRRGVASEHITLLPNSCEPERFSPRPRDEDLAAQLGIPTGVPVIGYIGTFVQYEGLELLVEAAAALRERGHTFRLLLVGNENASGQEEGPITRAIRRIGEERGLEEWLLMPGRVPHDEVERYYSLIDIAPFPRRAQPVTEMVSPMKPLEAFAMEKAVVASSVAALREMVDHERTGLIFEKENVGSLTDVLARLVEDPQLRMKLGKEARRWVENHRTWSATASIAASRIRGVSDPA